MPITETVLPPRLIFAANTLYAILGDLYSLDPGDGKLLRHYPLDGISELAVADGMLYVNVTKLHSHTVQALRASDGELLWQYVAESRLIGAPVIADGVVYIGVGGGTDEGSIHALRTSDGTLLWKYTIESGEVEVGEFGFMKPLLFASPIVANGVVYISTFANSPLRSYVYALDASTGVFFWQAALPEPTSKELAFLGENIYITTYKRCCALRADDGSMLWSQTIEEGGIYSLPIVIGEALYVSSLQFVHKFSFEEQKSRTGKKSQLHALRISDGAPLWNVLLAAEENADSGSVTDPAVSRTSIFIGTDDGCLSALYRNDGTVSWRYQTNGSGLSTPVITNDTVYIGVSDNSIVALRVSDGSQVWQTPLNGKKLTAYASIEINADASQSKD